MTTPNIVLWGYIVLLAVGGLIGYFKAGSAVSLVMSGIFACLLALWGLNLVRIRWGPEVLLGVLLAVFAFRLYKTGHFMPSGLMVALTAVTLLLRLWFR
jgi:uncharacterized membrane protein (UPF0136 family)